MQIQAFTGVKASTKRHLKAAQLIQNANISDN